MTRWFVAQVKPNADQIAKRNLERQGFSTFQPLEKRTVLRVGRFVDQARPCFAGYVFLSHPSEAPPFSTIACTYGVARLITFGDRPAAVPRGVIEALQAACDSENVISFTPAILPGHAVEVVIGGFSSFVGLVERLSPDQRAMVLLDFMGKKTRVNMPVSNLRSATCRVAAAGAVN